jgi:hypothetical protein
MTHENDHLHVGHEIRIQSFYSKVYEKSEITLYFTNTFKVLFKTKMKTFQHFSSAWELSKNENVGIFLNHGLRVNCSGYKSAVHSGKCQVFIFHSYLDCVTIFSIS